MCILKQTSANFVYFFQPTSLGRYFVTCKEYNRLWTAIFVPTFGVILTLFLFEEIESSKKQGGTEDLETFPDNNSITMIR